MRKAQDLTNKPFFNLTVQHRINETRNDRVLWQCICVCGTVTRYSTNHLTRKINPVKSCGCLKKRNGVQHKQWTGAGEISGNFWYNHVVRSANGAKGRNKLKLDVTKEYVWDLFLKQGRKCALSGIELILPKKWDDNSYTASLDRIDSSEGYTKENVQWVHKDINMMKRTYSQQHFVSMCKKVAENFSHPIDVWEIVC